MKRPALVASAIVGIVALGCLALMQTAPDYAGVEVPSPRPPIDNARAVKSTLITPLDVPGWATTTDSGFVFQYPQPFPGKYVSVGGQWPPLLAVVDGPFQCDESPSNSETKYVTKLHIVQDRAYCVTTSVEGAAGSAYTAYAYSFPLFSRVGLFRMTVREVQCDNYDEPERAECKDEQVSLDLDSLIDKMARSIRE